MFLLTPRIVGFFQRIFCRDFNYYYCDLLVGYDAVYRLGSAFTIWFIILAFATLGTTSSTRGRAKVQNGCWIVKTIGLIVLEILFVSIPHNEYNGEIWLFFGLNAAFCFIILQYTFILDAANTFCILYATICDNGHSSFSDRTINLLRVAKSFTTVFLYSVSLITSVGFYFMYGSYHECLDNFVFVSFNLIMCFASTVISLLPVVRDASPQMGLFQCAVTSLYCTYVMWLAFSSEPRTKCNPSDINRFPGSPMANIQVWVTLFITLSTLVYISTRDLVAPQFGKVDKTFQNSIKLAYNLQKDRKEISQKDRSTDKTRTDDLCTTSRKPNKRVSHEDVSVNLKLICNLYENENKLKDSKVNAISSPEGPFENSTKKPKEPEFSVSNHCLDTDSFRSKTSKERLSSLKSIKTDATMELDSASLSWDNTLFSCVKTNLTSASDKPIANCTPVTENSYCTTRENRTPASLILTEKKRIVKGSIYPTEKKETVNPKIHISKSASIQSSNFTSPGTLKSLTLSTATNIEGHNIDCSEKNDTSAARCAKPSSIENNNFARKSIEEASKLSKTKQIVRDTIASARKNHVPPKTLSNDSQKCLANSSNMPVTEISGFVTKGVPRSLSFTALSREREAAFDKCVTKTTGEHLTSCNPESNNCKTPLLACKDRTANETSKKGTDSGALIWDDEIKGIEYSYPFFHLTFSLASLYLIMSITNWYRLDEGEHLTVRLVQSWSAVWLRISASIFCSFILIWSMIIPVSFPETYKHLLYFQYLTSRS